MKKTILLLIGIMIAVPSALAEDVTLTVASGQTLGMQAALELAGKTTINANDLIIKMGGGTLIATNSYSGVKYNTRIVEGVYEARNKGDLGASGGAVRVKAGASLVLIPPNNETVIASGIHFWTAGTGCTSLRIQAGAIVFKTRGSWQVLSDCTFHLDEGNATYYSEIGHTANGCFTNGRLDCGNYLLTLKGSNADGSTGFRFRFGTSIKTASKGLVIDNAVLSASSHTYAASPVVQPLVLTNGASLAPDNQSFLNMFANLRFEAGTKINPQNACVLSLPSFSGFPTLGANCTTPTINSVWTLRACDWARTGAKLSASKALTFGANAKLVLADGLLGTLDAAEDRTIATSDVSISGTPTVTSGGGESKRWRTRLAAGKTLVLEYDMPTGVVNVRDWGVQPGTENAAANSSAFATGFASVSDGATVFFPPGSYSFAEPLAVGGKANVTLLGDAGSSVVSVTDSAAAAVVSDVAGSGLTITGLRLSGGAGVAIAASGASGLTVTNCVFSGIAGVVDGVEGTYPVSAVDCTDAFVCDNMVLDGATYTALAYVSGGSVRPGSEPQSTNVIIRVEVGCEDTFAVGFARTGLAAFPQDAQLVKRGGGLLMGSNVVQNVMSGVRVEEGTFATENWQELGQLNKKIEVMSGATLRLSQKVNGETAVKNQTLVIAGSGADGQGAIALYGATWSHGVDCTLKLADDATIDVSHLTGQAGFLSHPTIWLDGHTLTFAGNYPTVGADVRWREYGLIKSSGTIIVDRAYMSASYETGNGFRCDAGVQAVLRVKNGAYVSLTTSQLLKMFARTEWMDGTSLYVGYNAQWHDHPGTTLWTFSGAPSSITANASVADFGISNALVAVASDLKAGRYPKFPLPLALNASAVVDVEGMDDLPTRDAEGHLLSYTLATATGGITCTGKPKKGTTFDGTDWRLFIENGTTLKIGPVVGTLILVR